MTTSPTAKTPAKTPVKAAAKTTRAATPAKRVVKTPAKSPVRKAAPATKAATRKPVASPKAAPVAKAAKVAKVVEAVKIKAPKKPKLVRDSFTMPKDEYQAIDGLKQRATALQRSAKKSELLRAGIKALSAMDDKQLLAILNQVPALKTGRPGRD